ncbi:hypothetical protein LX32DRAFT_72531 [Colletotrichum zoysiae]|uniref:Uncharacterized protein n=1 Tax=Colletotrichum zoysiae TaxID=1216348 RepID=A0AAD9HB39_9PEZI|nr:hypothetical protein LX32DRAFT_72531 [Colletotrichum zoysiae]
MKYAISHFRSDEMTQEPSLLDPLSRSFCAAAFFQSRMFFLSVSWTWFALSSGVLPVTVTVTVIKTQYSIIRCQLLFCISSHVVRSF